MYLRKYFYQCHLPRASAQGSLGSCRALGIVSTREESWGRSSLAATLLLAGGSALGCSPSAEGQTFTEPRDLPHKHSPSRGTGRGNARTASAALPAQGRAAPGSGRPSLPSVGSSSAPRNSPGADARGDFMVPGAERAPEQATVLKRSLLPDELPPAYF